MSGSSVTKLPITNQILALLSANYGTLAKLLNLPVSQFPHQKLRTLIVQIS